MIDNILALILVTIGTLISFLFVKSFVYKNSFTNKDILIIFITACIQSSTAILLSELVLVKLVINLIVITFAIKYVFGISTKKSLIINLLFYGLLGAVEFVAILAFQMINGQSSYANLTNSNGAAVLEICCYLVILIFVALISVIKKKSNLSNLDVKGWFSFILYPAITLCVISFILYIPIENQNPDIFKVLLVFAVSMLFLSILQFYFVENIIQREIDIRNKQALVAQAEHIGKMYQSLSEEREEQKARSHDYRNHLNVLLALLEEDKKHEAALYLKEQIGKENERVDIIDTGNVVINAVLNIKYQEARNMNIVMPLIADDLSNVSISECDLVTILTNILDNAIEATQKSENKKIVMRIVIQNNMLCIDSSNTYVGEDYKDEYHYTTKTDISNHGYGIANIRQIVNANSGTCIIDAHDGLFMISITIPLK